MKCPNSHKAAVSGCHVFLRWVPFLRFLDQVLHRHHDEAKGLDSGVYFLLQIVRLVWSSMVVFCRIYTQNVIKAVKLGSSFGGHMFFLENDTDE